MKNCYEMQVQPCPGDRFQFVVTITNDLSAWTSRPAKLEATDWDSARKEAARQTKALIAVLEPRKCAVCGEPMGDLCWECA